MPNTAEFLDDTHLQVGDLEFDCAFPFPEVTPGRMQVMKNRPLVEEYIELFERLRPRLMVELGIRRGGSTALLHALAQPEKLVSIELAEGAPALAGHIRAHGLADVVRPYFRTDQADRERLAEILADEFGGRPLDFVVDDASHIYAPSVVSFEVLFPHLRPGGVYVIEDWSGVHRKAEAIGRFLDSDTPEAEDARKRIGAAAYEKLAAGGPTVDDLPLSRMALELVLMRTHIPSVVNKVTVSRDWIAVERGPEPLQSGTFRYADSFTDHFHQLTGYAG